MREREKKSNDWLIETCLYGVVLPLDTINSTYKSWYVLIWHFFLASNVSPNECYDKTHLDCRAVLHCAIRRLLFIESYSKRYLMSPILKGTKWAAMTKKTTQTNLKKNAKTIQFYRSIWGFFPAIFHHHLFLFIFRTFLFICVPFF